MRDKWRKSREGWKHSLKTKQELKLLSSKRIHQIGISSGRILGTFNSAKEAAESLNVWPTAISNVCKGRARTCGGFRWEYVAE